METTADFLKNWFVDHIMKSDQDYADWMKSFRGPAGIRAVIFDFGNVIARFDSSLTFGRLGAMCGVPGAELAARFQAEASLGRDFESGAISKAQFLDEVSRICGKAISEAEFVPAFTEIFTPIPSTLELIRKLKPNYRLGLISNTNPWHFEHGIRDSEAYPLFDAATLSFEAKALKPDPRIFQDCLDKLGLAAESCVFIDDIEAFAQAADRCLLHGICYRGPEALVRDLRRLKVSI